jgi:hypothetical protein
MEIFLVLHRPCGQLSYSGDHRKGPRLPGTILGVWSRYNSFLCCWSRYNSLPPPAVTGYYWPPGHETFTFHPFTGETHRTPYYPGEGIDTTTQPKRKGHDVLSQRFDWLYLPHFLLLKWVVVKYNGVPFTIPNRRLFRTLREKLIITTVTSNFVKHNPNSHTNGLC